MVGDGHAAACCVVCAQLVLTMTLSQLLIDGLQWQFLTTQVRRRMEEDGKQNECREVDETVLDSCGQNLNGSYDVCKKCVKSLGKLQYPWLSLANYLFCECWQKQLNYLAELTQIEQMVITSGRAFGSIINLQPNGSNPGVCYIRVKNYVVVVPLHP